MRINNIAANTAFGRVIKLNAPKEKVEFSADDRDFGVLHELENVLNSRNSRVYTKSQSEKIREFFKNILGDYNGENGIRIEKAYGDTVIISGEDAKKLKELEEKHGVSYKRVSAFKARGKNAEISWGACVSMGREIEKRKEDGMLGMPDSAINFSFKNIKDGKKAGRTDYSRFGKISYTSMHFISSERKMDDIPKLGTHTVFRSISYEENSLKI